MDEDPKGKSWDAHRASWQPMRNARGIPPARLQTVAADPIAVRARFEWMRDDTEFVDTVAYGWTARLVLVRIRDRRSRLGGVWLDAGDVTRR